MRRTEAPAACEGRRSTATPHRSGYRARPRLYRVKQPSFQAFHVSPHMRNREVDSISTLDTIVVGRRTRIRTHVSRCREGNQVVQRRLQATRRSSTIGQMLASFDVADGETKGVAAAASPNSVRPFRSRLEPPPLQRPARVDLPRRPSAKRRVRAMRVVPERIQLDLATALREATAERAAVLCIPASSIG